MLNEGIFLLRMLVYPFDNESYLWYYFLFGWGMYDYYYYYDYSSRVLDVWCY